MTDDQRAVLSANQTFYLAFAAHDFVRMDELWARHHEVTCIHPGWSLLAGRPAVMASWRAILESDSLQIEATDAQAHLAGEVAYVTCFEAPRGESPVLIATNIFVREDGAWRLIHHHAGQLAATPDPVEPRPTN
jgi:ketosteroid isomerase-like protein